MQAYGLYSRPHKSPKALSRSFSSFVDPAWHIASDIAFLSSFLE